LICSSTSTSRPSYYAKNVSLTYIWYKNDTVMTSETRRTLVLSKISRDERFNQYSCQANETTSVSEKSEQKRISVLCEYSNDESLKIKQTM
jgi:hypothetical protein